MNILPLLVSLAVLISNCDAQAGGIVGAITKGVIGKAATRVAPKFRPPPPRIGPQPRFVVPHESAPPKGLRGSRSSDDELDNLLGELPYDEALKYGLEDDDNMSDFRNLPPRLKPRNYRLPRFGDGAP